MRSRNPKTGVSNRATNNGETDETIKSELLTEGQKVNREKNGERVSRTYRRNTVIDVIRVRPRRIGAVHPSGGGGWDARTGQRTIAITKRVVFRTLQVRLRSANPFDKPVIHANFFADPADLDRIVEAIKMVIELSKTEPFRRLGSTLPRDPLVGCGHLEFGSDPYWACCVQTMTMQMHHQSGTCKMGPKWDRNAVVDAQLRVYGVDGLRVIDCSIMPTITGGHTVAPAYMIGEKGADLVKSAWLKNGTRPSR